MTGNQREEALPASTEWKRRTSLLTGGLLVLALAFAVRFASPPKEAAGAPKGKAANKAKKSAPADDSQPHELAAPDKPSIVAVVNGQPISRNELAQECLKLFGDDVLTTLVNKQLIVEHCKVRKIEVTHQEVAAEIDRMAQRFGLPTDQLLKMLKEERHITPDQYAKEIIWPAIALKKLAKERLTVSDKEIKEAYEVIYGPSVQTRLIACNTAADASRVRALALKDPDDFPNLAKKYSVDPSASAKGNQPIHKHEGNPEMERTAFSLKVGEISNVVKFGQHYVIFMCEAHLDAQKVPMKDVRERLKESIQDNKLRDESTALFKELEEKANFQDVFNDPAKRKKHPGVAALINGHEITMRELAEECLDRNGIDVLEGMINHRLLEQACKRKKIEISEADMQAEIERAAIAMGKTKKNRRGEDVADVKAWLEDVEENQKLAIEVYRDQSVWPSAALKKLVGKDVEISDEDMRKSYEANYGKRVRCRAIVFDRERKAQEIWTRLRDQLASEEFAALSDKEFAALSLRKFAEAASTYSVDQGSHDAQGQIPPIARFGTDPHMEKEAFSLHPGEMSGVIQIADKFVILYCEGYTKPVNTTFEDVKQEIIADLREKKLRVAMAQQYTKLSDMAQIENYLTNVTKSPEKGNPVDKILGSTGLLAEPEPANDGADGKRARKTVSRPNAGALRE